MHNTRLTEIDVPQIIETHDSQEKTDTSSAVAVALRQITAPDAMQLLTTGGKLNVIFVADKGHASRARDTRRAGGRDAAAQRWRSSSQTTPSW